MQSGSGGGGGDTLPSPHRLHGGMVNAASHIIRPIDWSTGDGMHHLLPTDTSGQGMYCR